MKPTPTLIAVMIGAFVVGNISAQDAIGPVTPKPPMTVSAYEKALNTLLKDDASDKVWDKLDTTSLLQVIQDIETAKFDVQGLPVGPVVPKPPKPKPKRQDSKPTKQDLEAAFEDLHEALEQKSKMAPTLRLPDAGNKALQRLLETAAKASTQ